MQIKVEKKNRKKMWKKSEKRQTTKSSFPTSEIRCTSNHQSLRRACHHSIFCCNQSDWLRKQRVFIY